VYQGWAAHLLPERVERVPTLEEDHKDHAVRDPAIAEVLLARARNVEQRPADDSRSDLVERLEVKVGEARQSGVERTSEEPLQSARISVCPSTRR